MKRCEFCRSKISKNWNYCPICGNELEKPVTIANLLRRQMDILRNLMKNDISSERSRKISGGITIKINSSGFHEPRIHVIQEPPYQEQNRIKKPEKNSRVK